VCVCVAEKHFRISLFLSLSPCNSIIIRPSTPDIRENSPGNVLDGPFSIFRLSLFGHPIESRRKKGEAEEVHYRIASVHSVFRSSTMSSEFCWTRTADHVRLAEIASRKSSCLAASFNQLQLVDPWANPSSASSQHRSSGLLIWTGQPQADDGTTATVATYDYRSLAFHINSWLENLPTV
jgi:hypothetical protein